MNMFDTADQAVRTALNDGGEQSSSKSSSVELPDWLQNLDA